MFFAFLGQRNSNLKINIVVHPEVGGAPNTHSKINYLPSLCDDYILEQ